MLARALGMPNDPVEATAFVGSRLRSGSTRRIHVGSIGDRYFIFSAGFGLDGEVARQVEANPERKRKMNHWFFLSRALSVAWKKYRATEPTITLESPGREPLQVLLGICCNGRPYTYFNRFPVDVCPEALLDGGLDLFAMDKIRGRNDPPDRVGSPREPGPRPLQARPLPARHRVRPDGLHDHHCPPRSTATT